MSTTQEAKELIYGNIVELELPSGFWVKIREQNGEDDDILSNPILAKDLSNVSILLSSLIIDTNLPFATGGKVNIENIDKLLVNDQAIILLGSRINSLGSSLEFTYNWGKPTGILNYTEDLNQYRWPYISGPEGFPHNESDTDYFKYRCKPYPADCYNQKYFTLSSGKEVRMKHMDMASQKKLIALPSDKNTKNSEFLIRDLELLIDGDWKRVENFKFFTSKDMQDLRKAIHKMDEPFKGFTELENPATGETVLYPFMGNSSFFFPGETEN